MQDELTFVLLQMNPKWESPKANRESIRNRLKSLPPKVDAVILPEMFTTGFSMSPQNFAEKMSGETVQWMQELVAEHQIALAGSLPILDQGTYKNRFLWVHPEGTLDFYDKRHLFGMGGEAAAYNPGANDGIIEFKEWRICLRICYDLRFPAWCRNRSDYDLLVFTANWPNPRIHAWDTLLQGRAIENMAYTIGVNRTGTDPNGNYYPGHSAAYDALGAKISVSEEDWIQVQLSAAHQAELRQKLPFLQDRDSFEME